MPAMISHYPRVSEWIYLGQTAINLAQVATIEFQGDGPGAQAIVRLSAISGADEDADRGRTWFLVKDAHLVRDLRAYIDGQLATSVIHEREAHRGEGIRGPSASSRTT